MIDILSIVNPPLTNGRLNEAQVAFARWQQFQSDSRQTKYIEYRDYYEGDHDTTLTDRQIEYLQIKTGQTFDANYCQIVVDALAERFIVKGFEARSPRGEMDETQGGEDGLFQMWWEQNRMEGIQGDVHTAALRDGDTFLIVEWDNVRGVPVFTHELAYDGSDGVSVVYQNEKRDKVWFGFKKWQTLNDKGENVNRLNIYTDNAIYKFTDDVRTTPFSRLFFNWQPYTDNEGDPWPIAWTTSDGQPLGCPVIHFRYKANGYNYGMSRLDNIIPMQNALNKSVIDLLAAADTTAFRIYTMIGDTPLNADGTNRVTVSPGGIIWSTRKPQDVSISHIPGEDLTPMIAIVDSFIMRIAQMSRTPLSYFQASKQLASDTTQEANDSGLVSMAERESTDIGNSWEDAMYIARRLYNAFGEGGLDETAVISTVWGSFKRINEEESERLKLEADKSRSEIFKLLLENKVSRELAAEIAGYPQEFIARLRDEVEEAVIPPALQPFTGQDNSNPPDATGEQQPL